MEWLLAHPEGQDDEDDDDEVVEIVEEEAKPNKILTEEEKAAQLQRLEELRYLSLYSFFYFIKIPLFHVSTFFTHFTKNSEKSSSFYTIF